jgi:hypothetical protein
VELDGLKLVSFKPIEREENLKEEKSGGRPVECCQDKKRVITKGFSCIEE